jgi:BolA family transcriptional regulator, general stress-responsive regulator
MGRQQTIESLISAELTIIYLKVLNESHMHSVPENSETHFNVTVVSDEFNGMSKVARHQKLYALLKGLMEEGLHALALHTYTSQEWQEKQQLSPASPDCMGGSKGA